MDVGQTVFLVLFFAAFPIVWVFILRQLAWTSGWQDLATSYRADTDFRGPKRYLQSGYVGRVSHGGSLILGADAHGLYMSVLAPFRIGHQPLYIPWGDVTAHQEKRFFVDYIVLTFAKHPNATLHTRPRTARRLAAWSSGRFVLPAESKQ